MPTKCGLNGGKDAGVNGCLDNQLAIPILGYEYLFLPQQSQYRVQFNSGGQTISEGTVFAMRVDGLWVRVNWDWEGKSTESSVPTRNCKKVKIDGRKSDA